MRQALQADEQGAVSELPSRALQCQLLSAGADANMSADAGAQAAGLVADDWRACAANASYSNLPDGRYLFSARPAGGAGDPNMWALSPFEVDRARPM